MNSTNFSVYNSEVIGLEPSIESKSGVAQNGIQTDNVKTAAHHSQTAESHSIGVQTTEIQNVESNEDILTSPALVAFLKRVTPVVLEALNEDLNVDWMNLSYDVKHERGETVYLQSIDCVDGTKDVNIPEGGEGDGSCHFLSVLALSWNSTGNTLAVGLGLPHHKHWCQHTGLIQLYKPERSVGDKWELYNSLNTEHCVTKLQYHPQVPFLLAYSVCFGEIYIQNVGDVSTWSRTGDKTNTPAKTSNVRCIDFKWLTSEQSEVYVELPTSDSKLRGKYLVLMVLDDCGSFALWKVRNDSEHLEMMHENEINIKTDNICNSVMTCFDIDSCISPALSRDIIVVGNMSGDINITHWPDMMNHKKDLQSSDMDYGLIEKHSGCVLAVKLCRDYITSLGADGEIRIHNISNKNSDTHRMAKGTVVPHMYIDTYSHCVFAATAKWSEHAGNPDEENIKLGCKAHKILTIPLKSFQRSNLQVTEEDVELSTCLAFNTNRNTIAVGENRGGVHIFTITKEK